MPNFLHLPGCHAERLLSATTRDRCDPFTRARWARRHLTQGEIVKRVEERKVQPAPVGVGWNSLAEELFQAKVEVVG